MKNILYIGDYYPNISDKTVISEQILKGLIEYGNKVSLLSKSWCSMHGEVIKKENIKDVEFLYGKYFIDPLQMQINNVSVEEAYRGLLIKILENEDIDTVIFADEIKYLSIMESIGKKEIDKILFISESQQLKYMMDDYIEPYINKILLKIDRIITYPEYSLFLKKIVKVEENKLLYCEPCHLKKNRDNLTHIIKEKNVDLNKLYTDIVLENSVLINREDFQRLNKYELDYEKIDDSYLIRYIKICEKEFIDYFEN